MSLLEFATWLQSTPFSVAIQSASWVVPTLQSVHILMIGVVFVSILMIALRVLVETSRDPTSHNLWPFELVIGFLAGIAVVLPGMLLGMALRWAIEGDRL